MDWVKRVMSPREGEPPSSPPTPQPKIDFVAAAATPTAPPPPPPQAVSQQSVVHKEAEELGTILKDSASLRALATAGLEAGTLEETPTLELLSTLSQRLLTRNQCRAAAAKFGAVCVGGSSSAAPDASVEAAAGCLLPSYFRQESTADDDGQTNKLYAAKVFLHALPAAPADTTLCARFSLQESSAAGSEEPWHDVNIKVMQIAPFAVGGGAKLSFSFGLENTPASQAADWTLDEAQRDKLTVLGQLLGLSSSRWTPAGVLGLLLATCGCGHLDGHDFYGALVKACREAHRDELLARAGSTF